MPADGGRPAMGVSDESGHFTLGTNDTGDGASTGAHPVAVAYVGPPNTDPEEGIMTFTPPPPPEVKIDKKYTNPATSGLTVQIPEDGTDGLTINLKSFDVARFKPASHGVSHGDRSRESNAIEHFPDRPAADSVAAGAGSDVRCGSFESDGW